MPDQKTAAAEGPSAALMTLFAVATGALVANLYYAQPLVAQIAPAIGITPALGGSIVSVTQLGYGVGLFLLVSLADVVESRLLTLIALSVTTAGLVGMTFFTAAAPFFVAAFLIGVCSTGAQVLVPLIAHLAPAERRGRVVGNVMAGLLSGIMLARPAALFVSASFGWRAVFGAAAVLMVCVGAALAWMMPRHQPNAGLSYRRVLGSMAGLFAQLPAVRWRSLYQALLFAVFNMFWTTVPLMLAARFGLSERGIGLFALAGAGGALAAPIAGRLADRGLSTAATAAAMAVMALTLLASIWAAAMAPGAIALGAMVVLTVILDGAVQINQVVSQRIVFAVPSEIRGRVNAMSMTIMFLGGAAGSVLGTLTYHAGGWAMTACVGGTISTVAVVALGIEKGFGLPRRKSA